MLGAVRFGIRAAFVSAQHAIRSWPRAAGMIVIRSRHRFPTHAICVGFVLAPVFVHPHSCLRCRSTRLIA